MLSKGEPYARVPHFYSDQYDVGMEYTGHAITARRLCDPEEPLEELPGRDRSLSR